jgi:multiple sugar transport system substrate-binding protein
MATVIAHARGPRRPARALTRRSALGSGAALLSGAGVLAACAAPGSGPAPVAEARDVTLTYVTDWSSGTRGEWIKEAIPKFTEENPRIKVQVDNWGGEVTVVAVANAAAGTLQDVMLGSNDVFIQLARAGGMQDITPVLRSLRVSMNDVIHLPSTHSYQGKQYGMPFQFGPILMMVNKTMFRQAGATLPTDKTTYPQLLDELRKIAKPGENIWGMQLGSTHTNWLPFLWSFGGERWTKDLKKSTIDLPPPIEGLQFYVDMMHRHRVSPPLNERGAVAVSGAGFNNGNVAIAYATAPGRGQDRTVAGKFEWDIMHHPLGPRTGKRNVFVNDQTNQVTATAVRRGVFEQAVRFIAWCSTGKTAQDLVVEIGPNAAPVSKAVLNSPKFLQGPPASQKLVSEMAPAFRDPEIFIGWNEWRDEVTAALTPAFANQKSVQDAAKDAARAGDVVLAKIPR